jgi:hypothetical protein
MSSNANKSQSQILSIDSWNPKANKYMPPKLNDKGGKSINVISTQSNRSIHLIMPLMKTWGIADFIDEKGEPDGKFSMDLNFPLDGATTPETDEALRKLKEFEENLLNDAVINSEAWFGKKQSREIVEYSYFPFLKYKKNKDTKAVDYSRPPSLKPKVPKYGNDWKIEIYDTNLNLLFPSPNNISPIELVPKSSNVASVIACGGIWVGGKGWGLTWKVIQLVVKPQVMESVFGKCHIPIAQQDRDEKPKEKEVVVVEVPKEVAVPVVAKDVAVAVPKKVVVVPAVVPEVVMNTYTNDSDNEEPVTKTKVVQEEEVTVPEVVQEEAEAEAEPEPEPVIQEAPKKKIVKKIITKKAV